MTWREILALPVAIVLLGVGALSWKVGDTWEPRNTDILITGLVTACGGGMVIMGVLLSSRLPSASKHCGSAARHAATSAST